MARFAGRLTYLYHSNEIFSPPQVGVGGPASLGIVFTPGSATPLASPTPGFMTSFFFLSQDCASSPLPGS